ncbi:hypothetical protein B0H11DRAFT_2109238 [Mycena galericulata]|nr:hypothetical protein B0H11DRAFT_2109238 [Mycena galericulata]
MTAPTLTPSMASITPPPPTPADIEKLLQLTQDAQTTSYFAVAALGLLIFDYLLSLDQEIEFVWKRRKFLASYIYNRYFALAITCALNQVPITQFLVLVREIKTDKIYTQFEGVSSTLVVLTVDIILLLRVWILFVKSRRLMYFLVPLMCGSFFISVFTIMHADSAPVLPGCYSLTSKTTKSFTMFVMTVYNCKTRLGLSFRSRNAMPIVNLFLRDGIFWFLAVVAVNPPQIIIWAAARPTLTELLIMVYSIIGSRVLLNIMEVMSVGVAHHQVVSF